MIRPMADSMRMGAELRRPEFLPPPWVAEERSRNPSGQGLQARGVQGAGGRGDLFGPLSVPMSFGPGGFVY